MLQRLLIALESLRVFKQNTDGQWSNTILSEYMTQNHPKSFRAALLFFGEEQYVTLSRLDMTIRTGKNAFQLIYGNDFYSYQLNHSHTFDVFQNAMTSLSHLVDESLSVDYDYFKYAKTIVDIGGGEGALIQCLLHRYPHLSAILFEHPNGIDRVTNKWLISSHSSHNVFNLNGRIWQNRTNVSLGDYFDQSDIPIVNNQLFT